MLRQGTLFRIGHFYGAYHKGDVFLILQQSNLHPMLWDAINITTGEFDIMDSRYEDLWDILATLDE